MEGSALNLVMQGVSQSFQTNWGQKAAQQYVLLWLYLDTTTNISWIYLSASLIENSHNCWWGSSDLCAAWKHRVSESLDNKGVFTAAWNDWMSHWPLMMSPLCSPLADKQNAVTLAAQHSARRPQEGWYTSLRYAPLEHLLTPQRNLQ